MVVGLARSSGTGIFYFVVYSVSRHQNQYSIEHSNVIGSYILVLKWTNQNYPAGKREPPQRGELRATAGQPLLLLLCVRTFRHPVSTSRHYNWGNIRGGASA